MKLLTLSQDNPELDKYKLAHDYFKKQEIEASNNISNIIPLANDGAAWFSALGDAVRLSKQITEEEYQRLTGRKGLHSTIEIVEQLLSKYEDMLAYGPMTKLRHAQAQARGLDHRLSFSQDDFEQAARVLDLILCRVKDAVNNAIRSTLNYDV